MEGILRQEASIVLQNENVELRMQEVGDMTVAFVRLAKGTDLSDAVKGLPDDLCPCPHWGYMLKGTLKMRTKHGDEIYQAGQAFYWSPGHVPIALEDCEYVDFSPKDEFATLIRHLTGGQPSSAPRPSAPRP